MKSAFLSLDADRTAREESIDMPIQICQIRQAETNPDFTLRCLRFDGERIAMNVVLLRLSEKDRKSTRLNSSHT